MMNVLIDGQLFSFKAIFHSHFQTALTSGLEWIGEARIFYFLQ